MGTNLRQINEIFQLAKQKGLSHIDLALRIQSGLFSCVLDPEYNCDLLLELMAQLKKAHRAGLTSDELLKRLRLGAISTFLTAETDCSVLELAVDMVKQAQETGLSIADLRQQLASGGMLCTSGGDKARHKSEGRCQFCTSKQRLGPSLSPAARVASLLTGAPDGSLSVLDYCKLLRKRGLIVSDQARARMESWVKANIRFLITRSFAEAATLTLETRTLFQLGLISARFSGIVMRAQESGLELLSHKSFLRILLQYADQLPLQKGELWVLGMQRTWRLPGSDKRVQHTFCITEQAGAALLDVTSCAYSVEWDSQTKFVFVAGQTS